MKKFLLLLAVAMLSVSAFAAKSVHLKSKAQWGEYMLSTTVPFSAEDYVSMKVTVANAVGAFQVKVTSTDIADDDYTNPAYPQFENNVCVFNFQDFLTSKGYTGNINRINLQACDGADQEIDVLEVILVKADGTEVVQELGGDAWGGGAFEATELEYQGGAAEEPETPEVSGPESYYKIQSADMVEAAWDSQFFVVLTAGEFAAGDSYEFSMDVKADKAATSGGQFHGEPGNYMHWNCVGNVSFGTDWKTFSYKGTVDAEANGAKSIAFNLNDFAEANVYYVANVCVKINGEEVATKVVSKYDRGEIVETEATDWRDVLKSLSETVGKRHNISGQIQDSDAEGFGIVGGKVVYQLK